MNATKFVATFSLVFLPLLASAGETARQSISDLPTLSKLLVHHLECTVILVAPEGVREENFFIANESGQEARGSAIAHLGSDELIAGASAQMLRLEWKRAGKRIGMSEMMIQKSPAAALVLLLADPGDEANQASVNCSAITFADRKGPGGRP